MFNFAVRHNQKTPSGVKLNVLQNGYLGFLVFFDFYSQHSKLRFFKVVAYKIRNFQVIQKTESMWLTYKQATSMHNFKAMSFLGSAMAKKKTGKGDDVIDLKCNFWHF